MKLDRRKQTILKQLSKSQAPMTGQALASLLSVTSRTIRSDIKSLNLLLKPYEAVINSEPSKGYYLSEQNQSIITDLIKDSDNHLPTLPVLPEGRLMYFIDQLLFNPSGLDPHKEEEVLFVSKSTLDKDLMRLEALLKPYQLITITKRNAMILSGSESSIRKLMMMRIYQIITQSGLTYSSVKQWTQNTFDLTDTVVDHLQFLPTMTMSGDDFRRLKCLVFTILYRCRLGFEPNEVTVTIPIETEGNPYQLLDIINSVLSKPLSNTESGYFIYSYKKYVCQDNLDTSPLLQDPQYTAWIDHTLNNLGKTFGMTLSTTTLNRLSHILYQFNVPTEALGSSDERSLKIIRNEYPLAYEMTIQLVRSMKDYNNTAINDLLIEKLALILATEFEALMMKREGIHRKLLIVCESGQLIGQLLLTKINRYFPMLDTIDIIAPYKLTSAIVSSVDLILTTTPLGVNDCPVIVVHPLLKDYDRIRISSVLGTMDDDEQNHYRFTNLFREALFIKDLKAKDKYDVIKVVCEQLTATGYGYEGFFQEVIEREAISSTAIGNRVAIPHAVGSSMNDNVISVAILDQPVLWGSDKVSLVFLVNIQNTKNATIEQIYRSFFNIVDSRSQVDRLLRVNNYYELIKLLNE